MRKRMDGLERQPAECQKIVHQQMATKKRASASFVIRFVVPLLLISLVMALSTAALQDSPAVIRIPDEERGYVSIQQAIDAIAEGGTIIVAASLYRETLRIEKSVTLQGESSSESTTRIVGHTGGIPVITIESAKEIEVVIKGVTVAECRSGSSQSYWGDGISVQGRARLLLQDARVSSNHRYGLVLLDDAYATLKCVEVSDNQGTGIFIGDLAEMNIEQSNVVRNGWAGLFVTDAARLDLSRCSISENGEQGVLLWEQAQATIVGSDLSRNGQSGLEVRYRAKATLVETTVLENGEHGMHVAREAHVEAAESSVCSNVKTGIQVSDRGEVESVACLISKNQEVGVMADDEANVTLQNCTVSDNGLDGIYTLRQSVVHIVASTFTNNNIGIHIADQAEFVSTSSNIEKNRKCGIEALEEAHATLQDTVIKENAYDGIRGHGSVQVTLRQSSVVSNGENGIFMEGWWYQPDNTWTRLYMDGSTIADNGEDGVCVHGRCLLLHLSKNRIFRNGGYGVHADASECGDLLTTYWFVGHVVGNGNVIPAENEGDDNAAGDVCPNWLVFLKDPMTERDLNVVHVSADPTGFSTIQEAIDRSTEGGTVILQGGLYKDCLRIEKDIHLCAAESKATVIDGGGEGIPIAIHAATVKLTGLTVTGGKAYDAIQIDGASDVEISDCKIRESLVGIILDDSAKTVVHGTEITDNRSQGIELWGTARLGASDSLIEKNRYHGVEILEDAHAFFHDCSISSNCQDGLRLSDTARAELIDCVIAGNTEYGILALDASLARGLRNHIQNNGCDLVGNVLPKMRLPLREESESALSYPSPEYATLQEAIDALRPGGVLELAGGEHTGGATIDKNLVIRAQADEAPILVAPYPSMAALSIVGDAALSLEQIAVRGGIVAGAGACVGIVGCKIEGCSAAGMALLGCAHATITDTLFEHCYMGISLAGASRSDVVGSTILSGAVGLYGLDASRIVIKDCTIGNTCYGIRLSDTSSAVALGCVFRENDVAILLDDEASLDLRECELIGNRTGVMTMTSECGFMEDTFTGSVTGSGNTVRENVEAVVCPPLDNPIWPEDFLADDRQR